MIDQDIDDIKAKLEARIAELEAALSERDAMRETAVKLARQAALADLATVRADARRNTLLEAAEILMRLAQGRRSMNLVEAARFVEDSAEQQLLSLPNAN
jgi:hypothetical protein